MTIREAIERARLPSSIDVIIRVQKNIASETSSAKELAEAVRMDAGLTARVLRIANSPYYGNQRIESVDEAVNTIGTDDLTSLIVSTEVIDAFRGLDYLVSMEDFWAENTFTAEAARALARQLERDSGRLFTAGLLHGIGHLVLFSIDADRTRRVLERIHQSPELMVDTVERELFGFDHAEVGAELLNLWDVPEGITTPVRYYLHPERISGEPAIDAAILNRAYGLTCERFFWPGAGVDPALLERFTGRADAALLADVIPEIRRRFDQSVSMLVG